MQTAIFGVVGLVLGLFFIYFPLIGAAIAVTAAAASEGGPALIAVAVGLWALVVGLPVAGYLVYQRRVRRTAPPGVGLAVSQGLLRRGETVEATVTVDRPPTSGERLEVGLVCTVFHDQLVVSRDSQGHTNRRRATQRTELLADWRPVSASERFAFTIPPPAPFSHDGECISFAWRVSVRKPSELARDPAIDVPLWVAP